MDRSSERSGDGNALRSWDSWQRRIFGSDSGCLAGMHFGVCRNGGRREAPVRRLAAARDLRVLSFAAGRAAMVRGLGFALALRRLLASVMGRQTGGCCRFGGQKGDGMSSSLGLDGLHRRFFDGSRRDPEQNVARLTPRRWRGRDPRAWGRGDPGCLELVTAVHLGGWPGEQPRGRRLFW